MARVRYNKKNKLLKSGIIVFGVAAGGIWSYIGALKINEAILTNKSKEVFKELYDYQLHTVRGVAYKYNIINNELPILFEGVDNAEALECVEQCTNQLDEVLHDTKVTLYTNKADLPSDNYFQIIEMAHKSMGENVTGNTNFSKINRYTGELNGPITISVDYTYLNYPLNFSKSKYDKDNKRYVYDMDNSLFVYELLHEFKHGLGGCHVDKEDPNKTIMYATPNYKAENCYYTQFDKYSIQKIYDKKVTDEYDVIPYKKSKKTNGNSSFESNNSSESEPER